MRRRTLALVLLLLGGSGAAVHHLGLTTGSTRQERRRVLPGDGLLARPRISATHATSLAAPPDEVWPWLLQVGWHRGGWYTPRWVDVLMFPDNLPSADRVVPELQGLEVGDWVPDGPPGTGCGFEVREVEPHRHLVLESTTHLPSTWRRRGTARLHWTWAFVLDPEPEGGTRLVFRWRARTWPWWLTAGGHAFVVPADLVMSRGMFRGLRRRVDGHSAASG